MNGDPQSSFAYLLRRYRKAAYLTQEDLAERSRLSVRAISDLERGTSRAPRNETLALLAKALGLHTKERAAFKAAARNGVLPDVAREGSAAGVEPALIGRSVELAEIDRHLSGEGPPVLMLVGEPGIGKSRLLRTAVSRAPRHGLRVLMGGCMRSGMHSPYSPLLEMLRRLFREMKAGDLTRTLHGCAWLVRLLPELRDGPIEPLTTWSLPPEQERRLMEDAVKQVLVNIAGPSGTLLILDDLQWARTDTLDLLATLVVSSPEGQVRIVGAYRDTEVKTGNAFFHFMADLSHTASVTRLSLGPLAPDDAARLLGELAGSPPTTTALERTLERAGGVPFFLVNLAHLLRENPSDEPRNSQSPLENRGMPWNVVQAVQQRVAVLGEDAWELLEVAAFLGGVVPRALLSRVLDRPESKLLPLLEAACRARLLEEKGAHAYRFSHEVIREVLEANLSTARRSMLQGKVADISAADSVDPVVEKVAFHYAQTEDHAGAASWVERAAARALTVPAREPALEFYRAALARAKGGAAERTILIRLQERLGDLYRLHLDLDSALVAYSEARGPVA